MNIHIFIFLVGFDLNQFIYNSNSMRKPLFAVDDVAEMYATLVRDVWRYNQKGGNIERLLSISSILIP